MPLEEWLRKESTGELAASGDFEVEALAAERTLGKKRQFLVKWKVHCCQLGTQCSPSFRMYKVLHMPSSCAVAPSGQAEGAPLLAADMVLMLSAPLCEIGIEHVLFNDLRICCDSSFFEQFGPGQQMPILFACAK